MRKALERFNEIIFNPAIRWYQLPKPTVRRTRYPAPGSEPINREVHQIDYKTAFRDSPHNIRYHHEIHSSDQTYHSSYDPVGETTTERLVRYGYLNKDQVNNAEAVAAAAKEFQEKEKRSPSNNIIVDQISNSDKPVTKENRESVAHHVRQQFEFFREVNAEEVWSSSIEEKYNPELYIYKTYDMAADDPVWRQVKLDLEWTFENIADRRESLGYMPTFKGDPNFWQALDNSFSPENIAQVQSSIGDKVTNIDTKALALNHQTEEYHKTSKLVYPIRTNLVVE
ncbi:hypothetical protein ABPG74_013705 [Tetrahymena malaccensis]